MRRDPLAPMILPVQWVTAMVNWMKAFEERGKLPFPLHIAQGDADKTVDWRKNTSSSSPATRTSTCCRSLVPATIW